MKKTIAVLAVLAIAGMAANAGSLVAGKNDGINTVKDDLTWWGSGWQYNDDVVDIMVSGNDVFTVGVRGLAHSTYDPATDTLGALVNTVWHNATGVAMMPNGTIVTSQGAGLNAWSWNGSAFTELRWSGLDGYNFDARDIAVDSAGILHVAQNDGVSAWTFDGSNFAQLHHLGGAYSGGSAVYVGDDDVVRYGKHDGVNSLTWNGSTYTDIGYSATGGNEVQDIVIDDDGMWLAHAAGVHLFDDATAAYKGHFGDGTNYSLTVDSAGQLYAGKHDGVIEWNWNGTAVATGDFFNTSGWSPIYALEAIPEPATLGLFSLIGGGMLWIRKRFTI